MTITGISTNVQELLENTGLFQTVLAAPPNSEDKFNGYPSACHYYVNAESNFATVSQNRRVLEYVIEIYLVTGSENPTATELGQIYMLADETMDMLDESIDLSSTALGLARACDIMRPTPSALERVTTEEGPGIMLSLRLFCEADTTFRNS